MPLTDYHTLTKFYNVHNNSSLLRLQKNFLLVRTMNLKAFALISVFAGFVPLVSACEGECIVGITNAWLGNYTVRIDSVMKTLVRELSCHCQ